MIASMKEIRERHEARQYVSVSHWGMFRNAPKDQPARGKPRATTEKEKK